MSDYGVVVVRTSSEAFRMEKLLQAHGIRVKLIPVPREISSDCGLAVRFGWTDADRIRAKLAEAGLVPVGLHHLE